MSDTSLATLHATTSLPAPVDTKPKPPKVTGKLRQALDLMVWQGTKRDEAATQAGMLPKSLYNALRKHHVKAYYLGELEVLRTSARARNIHVLEEVRDQTGNQMARVNAVKALEQISDDPQRGPAAQTVPGLVIQIVQQAAPLTAHSPLIDAKPLKTLDRGVSDA